MIELKNVTKAYRFGKGQRTVAVDSVNLTVEDGEMTAIVGPSGAGKSTLLHIIGGLCNIDSGSYLFDGVEIATVSEAKRSRFRNQKVGIVMQSFALVEEYSVLENVMIPLLFRSGVKGRRKAAEEAVEKTGISHLKNKCVRELSGGERQRCAIARCLCQNPSLILADEPTGQLDSVNSEKIMDLFSRLNEEGMTVLIVTHDEKIAQRCNRIVTIRDGKIESDRRR